MRIEIKFDSEPIWLVYTEFMARYELEDHLGPELDSAMETLLGGGTVKVDGVEARGIKQAKRGHGEPLANLIRVVLEREGNQDAHRLAYICNVHKGTLMRAIKLIPDIDVVYRAKSRYNTHPVIGFVNKGEENADIQSSS